MENGMKRSGLLLLALLVGLASTPPSAWAQAEQVVEIPTRPGQTVRALLLKPDAPVGSIILLAGGHGNLALGKDGRFGWGAGNQLARTRAGYAKAGFVTLVPDIARDLKRGSGGVPRYRWSEAYAQDIGALVVHMRKLAEPVYLVGTSRASLSVANAAARLSGPQDPDALVITSGMLMHVDDTQPSVERNVGRLDRITQPTFIVFHAKDGCRYTPASSAKPFQALLTKAAQADVRIVEGGSAGRGDPCQAHTHHGFEGQDGEVVKIVTDWLKALRK
jgi:dienelactone hydrolase